MINQILGMMIAFLLVVVLDVVTSMLTAVYEKKSNK